MNSCEIQCITQGLQIDKAGLSTRIQSQMDKTNDFYAKPAMTQASKVSPSTSRKMALGRNLGHRS